MLKRVLTSAVTAYVILALFAFSGQFALHRSEQRDIARNCVATQHDWDTFQHLIDAATHPPSRAGQKLTARQVAALASYRASLTSSIGQRPEC